MKKLIALLLVSVISLSFAACANNNVSENPYEKYDQLIALLENQDYQGAIAEIERIGNLTPPETSNSGSLLGSEPSDIPEDTANSSEDSNIISIHTAEELFNTVYDSEKTYILENDLDLTGFSSTIPEMRGIFDGNGKTIRNATAVLVQDNRGTIQDLTMEDCHLVTDCDSAILVVNNYGTVRDCAVSGFIEATAKNIYAGGVACWNKGTIEDCVNYAQITAVSYALNELGNEIHGTFACAGGISAYNQRGMISRCWNEGTISARDADYLSSCGGIVAMNTNGEITDCYNTGSIIEPEGRGDSGGIAGNNEVNAKLVRCYNIGAASSGICGDNRDYIIDCYYLSSASENGSGSGLNTEGERFFAFTESELTVQETFSAFDFTTVWKMSENGPVLQ